MGNLNVLRGIREVSIAFPRDRATEFEKSQGDVEPDFPGHPCAAMRNDLADDLRANPTYLGDCS